MKHLPSLHLRIQLWLRNHRQTLVRPCTSRALFKIATTLPCDSGRSCQTLKTRTRKTTASYALPDHPNEYLQDRRPSKNLLYQKVQPVPCRNGHLEPLHRPNLHRPQILPDRPDRSAHKVNRSQHSSWKTAIEWIVSSIFLRTPLTVF